MILIHRFRILGIPSIGRAIGFTNAGPMKVIKAARVLRPLKLVSGVPSMIALYLFKATEPITF